MQAASSHAGRFSDLVPPDVIENCRFRTEMLAWAQNSKARQSVLIQMCREDVLFFFRAFAFTFDLIDSTGHAIKVIPFIPYDFQADAILKLNSAIGTEDAVIRKSRDLGASWLLITLFDYRMLFQDMETFLVVSRNEKYVDDPGNPDCLFWKIDFLHRYLPGWMAGKKAVKRSKLHFECLRTGGVIDGEGTTGNIGRGGRRTAIGIDEFAAFDKREGFEALSATQAATRSRIINSTPQGAGNAYSEFCKLPGCRKITMHWSMHPVRKRGLYHVTDKGQVHVLDTDWHGQNPGYDFRRMPGGYEGLRSPWYDAECDRTPIPSQIAQEQDMDERASGAVFFDREVIDRHKLLHCCQPRYEGEFEYSAERAEPKRFSGRPRGRMRLWCALDPAGLPPREAPYVIACDVATGTGASNSTISIVNAQTHEKIGEFADHQTRPEELARLAVALCRWFVKSNRHTDGVVSPATLVWEANGPGRTFGQEVERLGYRNVWYRRREDKPGKPHTEFAGWWSDPKTKSDLLSQYRMALAKDLFINPSETALSECLEYIHEGQTIWHAKALSTIDASGARENHGDRVIADALASLVLNDDEAQAMLPDIEEPQVPDDCFAARQAERRKVQAQKQYWINAA